MNQLKNSILQRTVIRTKLGIGVTWENVFYLNARLKVGDKVLVQQINADQLQVFVLEQPVVLEVTENQTKGKHFVGYVLKHSTAFLARRVKTPSNH